MVSTREAAVLLVVLAGCGAPGPQAGEPAPAGPAAPEAPDASAADAPAEQPEAAEPAEPEPPQDPVARLFQGDRAAPVDVWEWDERSDDAGNRTVLGVFRYDPRAEWEAEREAAGTLDEERYQIQVRIDHCRRDREISGRDTASCLADLPYDPTMDDVYAVRVVVAADGTVTDRKEEMLDRTQRECRSRGARPSMEMEDVDGDRVLEALLSLPIDGPGECPDESGRYDMLYVVDAQDLRLQARIVQAATVGSRETGVTWVSQWEVVEEEGGGRSISARAAAFHDPVCPRDADGFPVGDRMTSYRSMESNYERAGACFTCTDVELPCLYVTWTVTCRYDARRDLWVQGRGEDSTFPVLSCGPRQ
jgi:hypothetical protein